MSLMSLMPTRMLPNMGLQTSQQQAMTSSLGLAQSTATSATAATAPAATGIGGVSAADDTAAAQAKLGATAVLPPKPGHIVISSTLRGAVTGASLMFTANRFMPGALTKVVGFLSFVPFMKGLTFPVGTMVALGAGAAVGAVFGLLSGMRKAKKAAAAYNAAVTAAAAAQPAAGAAPTAATPAVPAVDPAAAAPLPAATPATTPALPPVTPAATAASIKARRAAHARKNPVMGRGYRNMSTKGHGATHARTHARAGHGSAVSYHIRRGDTLWAISRRYHTSIEGIMALNGKIKNRNLIYAGDTITINEGV